MPFVFQIMSSITAISISGYSSFGTASTQKYVGAPIGCYNDQEFSLLLILDISWLLL